MRQGYGALHCNAGERRTEGGGGCVPVPASDTGEPVCIASTGNPVDLVSGNKHQTATDFMSQGPQPLGLTRSYNSLQAYYAAKIGSGRFGKGWRTEFDTAAFYYGSGPATPTNIHIILPGGRESVFKLSSGLMKPAYWKKSTDSWAVPRTDVDESVTLIGGVIWRYVGPEDTAYDFNLTGQLTQIRTRAGYVQTFSYDAAGKNTGITDNLGRSIGFTYNAVGLTDTITDPYGKVYRYVYRNQLVLPAGVTVQVTDQPSWVLEKVIYPDGTPLSDADNPSLTYHYENASFPFALTGVTDEKGVRFATWAYDAEGRAISSQHAGGVEATSIAYDDLAKTRTITNPLNKQAIYQLEPFQEQLRIKQIAGQPSANCVAADTVFVYDANGYISQETDGKGNVTKYVRDARGQETSRTEAFGSPEARTITTSWHATFRLPLQIAEPGLTTAFSYDSDGLLLSRTEADTTSHTVPYSTNGQTRSWSFSYLTPGLLDVVDGPLPGAGDSINYDYDANGFLSQIINEAGHATQITSVNGRGQPLSITDPNGVIRNLAYDARGWLTSVTVDPGGPALAVTSLTYDAIGQITRITRPDGSLLDYAYDDARRLISVSNASNEKITYAYDAMGNRTQTDIRSAANAITATQSRTFDELGRLMRELGATAQTTVHSYDKVDNRISTLDPRSKLYSFAFDALNRLTSETDPALAQITYSRNAADDLTTLSDPRSVVTAFVHNGWGEVIRETSPDRGITDYVRNAQGNVTQKTDARGVVSSFTYDSLGRVLARSFPAAPTENVQYFYDDITGGNRGIGRLTKITDKSGETSFKYDVRGNAVREARVIAGKSYETLRAYDPADNLVTLTYPSGRIVNYARDALGRVISVSTKINAAATPVTVASGITHAPFGPLTGLSFGNGIVLSQSYDQDYRLSTLAATGVQNLVYSHDAAGNISAIADAVNPSRSQSFAYDDLNRLIAASGVYGAYGYSYDLSGNRIASSRPAANVAYTIALGSNRLMQISGGAARSFIYDAAGNAANDNRGPGADYSYTYDAAGDMAQADRDGLTLARYTSDARRLRVVRDLPGASVPKTHFIYDADGQLLAEHDGVNGAALREVIWLDDLPLAWVDATASGAPLYTVHADHLGTPQKLTDAAGAIVWDGVFAPFGETHAITGTLAQNLRFPGQYADSETALSYNWHRSYDPALGRYLQSDPIGLEGGINSYAYVEGNPLRYTDPEGLFVPALLAGAAISPEAAAGALALSAGAAKLLDKMLRDNAASGASDHAEYCRKEREACDQICEKAECDPDMKNIWGGNRDRCMRGCLPAACGGNKP